MIRPASSISSDNCSIALSDVLDANGMYLITPTNTMIMKIPTVVVEAGMPNFDANNIKINDNATEGIKYGKNATLLTVTPKNDFRLLDTA